MRHILMSFTVSFLFLTAPASADLWSRLKGAGPAYEQNTRVQDASSNGASMVRDVVSEWVVRSEIRHQLDDLAPAVQEHVKANPNDGALIAIDVYSDDRGNHIAQVKLASFGPDPTTAIANSKASTLGPMPPGGGFLKDDDLSYKVFTKIVGTTIVVTGVLTTTAGQTGTTAVAGLSDVGEAIRKQVTQAASAQQGAGSDTRGSSSDHQGGGHERRSGTMVPGPESDFTIEIRPAVKKDKPADN